MNQNNNPEISDPASTVLDAHSYLARQQNRIAELPLFKKLDFHSYHGFLLNCEFRALDQGYLLIAPEKPNKHLFVLLSGELTIYIDAPGSKNSITLSANEFVGEVSIIDGMSPTGFVVATQASEVLCIPEEMLWGDFFTIPGVPRNFLQQLAKRMRERNAAIFKSVEQTMRLEYLEKELQVATSIQVGMLPMPPFFDDCPRLAVDAFMKPAKEVGGDFYDAFQLDDDRICIAIGDVSGKGVPAALFMARSLTLLRIEMLQTRDLIKSIRAVNAVLCQDNPTCMFVTLMICVFNTVTRELEYVNGGHNPAVFGSWKDGYQYLPQPAGILIGINPKAKFDVARRIMLPGDTLLLYTDGVTEAMNPAGEEFSDKRLVDYLNSLDKPAAETLIALIHEQVTEFAGDAEQSDDITMVVLNCRG